MFESPEACALNGKPVEIQVTELVERIYAATFRAGEAKLTVYLPFSRPLGVVLPDYGKRMRFTTTCITLAPGVVGDSACCVTR
jgi:hypothetical protein